MRAAAPTEEVAEKRSPTADGATERGSKTRTVPRPDRNRDRGGVPRCRPAGPEDHTPEKEMDKSKAKNEAPSILCKLCLKIRTDPRCSPVLTC